VYKEIRAAVTRVEFVSEKILCMILRGHLCDIFILNMHAPTEDKSNDTEGSFYDGLI
jgi:hypothetical protein